MPSSRVLLLLLTTAWLSSSTVSSTLDPPGNLFCDDRAERPSCACAMRLANSSTGVLAAVNCENANLTEVPDLRQIGYPIEYL